MRARPSRLPLLLALIPSLLFSGPARAEEPWQPAFPPGPPAAPPEAPQNAPLAAPPGMMPGTTPVPAACLPPVCGACVSRPGVAPAPPAPPVILKHELRPRYGLIGGGAALLGVMYSLTVLGAAAAAAGEHETAIWPLYLPVVGPFLQLRSTSGPAQALLVFDGVSQLGGLTMMILGGALKKKVLVYESRISLAPAPLMGGSGLVATGRF